MNFMFNLSGNNIPLIKEYEIDEDTVIAYGEAVGIADGKVVRADGAEALLGVSAEAHSGEKDELNVRSNGNKIRVIISPDAVYGVKAKEYAVISGTADSITVRSDGLAVSVNSGYAVLVKKAENSVNTDAVGTRRKITGCAVSGAQATVNVEAGGVACEGDIYVLIPEIADEVQLDENGTGVCFFRQNSTLKFITVSNDNDGRTVYVKLCDTVFA